MAKLLSICPVSFIYLFASLFAHASVRAYRARVFILKQRHMHVHNLYNSLGSFSRRYIDIDFYFIFPRKQESTFYLNCPQFVRNVKFCFLAKKKNKKKKKNKQTKKKISMLPAKSFLQGAKR